MIQLERFVSDVIPNYIKETKKELDQVSPSFCLAKWLQVTLHLQNGQNHSCHHPAVHSIKLEEIKDNPSAIHNTKYKKEQRKKMLNGERPKECQYCWNIEDTPGDNISDRYFKSALAWSKPYLNKVSTSSWSDDINPSYLEVSFGSECNFKCSYCQPHVSSSIMADLKKNGPYHTSESLDLKTMQELNLLPCSSEDNPYIGAFWKWWPSLYPDLDVMRITGGEPLINNNTFKILEYIAEFPNNKLELAINTNLGVPQAYMDKFIGKIKTISKKKQVKDLRIFTSIDAFGKHAEYIRNGLDYKQFVNNVELLCKKIPDIKITIMCTFNALSIFSFEKLLKQFSKWRGRFGLVNGEDRFFIDISYLHYPSYQSVKVLPPAYVSYVDKIISFVESRIKQDNVNKKGFLTVELAKIKRIAEWMKTEEDQENIEKMRKDFYLFFREYDKRNNTNFIKTFPEAEEFWILCKNIK